MYCPSCGSEITVELNYCNRCGANLSVPSLTPYAAPVKLTIPSIVMGLTIVGGLGIIFSGATELVGLGLHPAALAWIVIFGLATLFGCTALLIRFWSMIIRAQRPNLSPATPRQRQVDASNSQQLPPRYDPATSVTEHTTRTFAPLSRVPTHR